MGCSPSGSSVRGILQARILEWVAMPSSRGSSHPRIEPRSPALQDNSFANWTTREALKTIKQKRTLWTYHWGDIIRNVALESFSGPHNQKCISRVGCEYAFKMLWAPESHLVSKWTFPSRLFFFFTLHDIDISKNNSIPNSWVCVLLLKVYFRKGKVLHDAGFLGDALQLFLQCLALDEDFAPAKLEVEKVICLPTVTLPASFPTTQVFLPVPVRILG